MNIRWLHRHRRCQRADSLLHRHRQCQKVDSLQWVRLWTRRQRRTLTWDQGLEAEQQEDLRLMRLPCRCGQVEATLRDPAAEPETIPAGLEDQEMVRDSQVGAAMVMVGQGDPETSPMGSW